VITRFTNSNVLSHYLLGLHFTEFAPSFAKRPLDTSLSAAVGGNITIVCAPEAAPAPEYQWSRNGADLGLIKVIFISFLELC
jgi:hypothetical protein